MSVAQTERQTVMSKENYKDIAQLRFWTEEELQHRDLCQSTIVETVRRNLQRTNQAWRVARLEGPQLTPRSHLSDEYTDEDIWTTPVTCADQQIVLRAETTTSTYAYVRENYSHKKLKLPMAFWQVGKSFRREKTSSASKLRFFEFTQLELQCLYSIETKADYRSRLLPDLEKTISWLTASKARIVESDRLPSYSLSTMDIEVLYRGSWREMASISIRNDFAEDVLNLEVAVGLDRLVEAFNASST
jgi:glycyl-tRNA synthetase